MCNKADISMSFKICDSCRKKLAKLPDLDTLTESPTQCDSPTDEQYLDAPEAVAYGGPFVSKLFLHDNLINNSNKRSI